MTATASKGEQRLRRSWGHNTPFLPTWALSLVSKARKLASQEVTIASSNNSCSGSANPNSSQQSERHTHGGHPTRGALSQHSSPAIAYSQPHDPHGQDPPSPGAPFPLGSGCVGSPHSPHPVKPPINPLLFPAPKYRQLPAPSSLEWGCN